MLKRLQPKFSSMILMDSCLTLRSFIHLEFIFVYGIRKWSSFILLHVAVQFSQQHLLKRLFSTGYSSLLCQRLVVQRAEGPFLGSLFCSIGLCVCFCSSTMLSLWSQLCSTVWNLATWCPQLSFSFSSFLWWFRVFSGSIQILGLFGPPLWKMSMVF